MDCLSRKSAALEPDKIKPRQLHMIAERHSIGDHVSIYAGDATDHCPLANASVLLNGRKAAEDHALANMYMSRKRRAVGEGHVVINVAVMPDMAIRHEIPIVADSGDPAACAAAAIHSHRFPDDAVCTDRQLGLRKIIFPDLPFASQHRLRVDDRSITNAGPATDHDMREKAHAVAENRVALNQAKWTDFDAGAKSRTIFDNGRRMHRHCHRSLSARIMALKSASAHTTSPTRATPSNFHTGPRC